MIRFLKNLLTVIFIATLFQCQPSTKTNSEEETTTSTSTQAAAPAAELTTYPSITQEKMMYLYENCDYIDFVFYSTNFSMSQGDQAAIRATLSGVSTDGARVASTCQPIGRVFFQVDGVNVEEADLFFGGECLSYVFYQDGKYAYGNQLAQSGFDFYQKVFAQVTTQQAQ